MTEYEKAMAACRRPYDFFRLSQEEQWTVDKELGILDWDGFDTAKAREVLAGDKGYDRMIALMEYRMSPSNLQSACDALDAWLVEARKSAIEQLAEIGDED